jgi:hypothetical protein
MAISSSESSEVPIHRFSSGDPSGISGASERCYWLSFLDRLQDDFFG